MFFSNAIISHSTLTFHSSPYLPSLPPVHCPYNIGVAKRHVVGRGAKPNERVSSTNCSEHALYDLTCLAHHAQPQSKKKKERNRSDAWLILVFVFLTAGANLRLYLSNSNVHVPFFSPYSFPFPAKQS